MGWFPTYLCLSSPHASPSSQKLSPVIFNQHQQLHDLTGRLQRETQLPLTSDDSDTDWGHQFPQGHWSSLQRHWLINRKDLAAFLLFLKYNQEVQVAIRHLTKQGISRSKCLFVTKRDSDTSRLEPLTEAKFVQALIFRMVTIQQVRLRLHSQAWLASLDLVKAYWHTKQPQNEEIPHFSGQDLNLNCKV